MPLEDLVRRWSPAGARVVPAPWTSPRPEGWTRFVCFSDPGRSRRRMAPYGATGFTRRELWKMEDTSKIFQVIYVIWPFLMGTLNEHDQPVEFRVFFAKESDKPSCTWVWYLIFLRGKPSTSAGWEHSLPHALFKWAFGGVYPIFRYLHMGDEVIEPSIKLKDIRRHVIKWNYFPIIIWEFCQQITKVSGS